VVLVLALLLIIPGGVGFSAGATKVFVAARTKARSVQCLSNVKELGRALMMYVQDWDETYPPAESWSDGAARYLQPTEVQSLFRCPAAASPYSYAFNEALDRMPLRRLDAPTETVMLLESAAKLRNATGDRDARAVPPRHSGGANYGFADGHARWANPYGEASFLWEVRAGQ
jgi:prepilin-type processing-associated H-X9-DG protein